MRKSKFKHYNDPADWFSLGWKQSVSLGYITISDAVKLSGFTKQYVYKQIKCGNIHVNKNSGLYNISWKAFVLWYGALPVNPSSIICPSSYSLHEVEKLTGMKRCWIFRFVDRNEIISYYVGRNRRFNKVDVDSAWQKESSHYRKWISVAEVLCMYRISEEELYYAIARHKLEIKYESGEQLLFAKDVKLIVNRKEEYK